MRGLALPARNIASRLSGAFPRRAAFFPKPFRHYQPGLRKSVDVPHGTLMLCRSECLRQIGLFDERYFAYGDEHELGLRARRHGWKVVMVWGAIVTNPGTWTESPLRSYLFARNSLLLVRDYAGRWQALLRALLILLNTFRLMIRSPGKTFRLFRARTISSGSRLFSRRFRQARIRRMRILFSSYAFRPGVGGIETVSEILAEEFAALGHEVRLITETRGDESDTAYQVIRRPSLPRLLALLRWSDVFFQNNISLRSLLPAVLMQKRTVVVHQTWIRNVRGQIDLVARLKRMLLGSVTNVAISRAVAEDIARESLIIPIRTAIACFACCPKRHARENSFLSDGSSPTKVSTCFCARSECCVAKDWNPT